MDLNLGGRIALITGASKGIGRATAKMLAAEGCHLHLVSRSKDELDRVAADIRAQHQVNVSVAALDLAKVESIDAMKAMIADTDILVNNAGAIPLGTIEEMDDAGWRQAWDLKVFGYINLTRAAFSSMKARGKGGSIINIIGHAGENLSASYLAGTSGCAALMALSQSLGSVSPDHGIRVVGINPGAILTDRSYAFLQARAQIKFGDPARWQELVKSLPFGRQGKPEEIAAAVAYLVSDHAAYISGTILTIDGGVSSRVRSWL